MEMLFPLLLTAHILVGMAIIGLVLIQHGKGADMGAAFGSGASGSLFGASGSANFLSRATAILAAVFFATSLGLTYMATAKPKASGSIMDTVKTLPADSIPKPAEVPLPVTESAAPTGSPVDSSSKAAEDVRAEVTEPAPKAGTESNSKQKAGAGKAGDGKQTKPAKNPESRAKDIPK